MPGLGDSWGTREEMLHPRDKGGRFRTKWKMPENVVNRIQAFLAAFSPRQFQSDNQSAQYLQNKAKPARFSSGAGYHRLHVDYDEANEALRRGEMDPETRKFVKQMDDSSITTTDDLILTRTMDPEAFGLTAQNAGAEDGGMEDFTGKVIADRGYSAANVGTPMGMGPGRIQMTIATPRGTKLIVPSRSGTDRGVFLDRDQPYRITKVTPDGRGGYYVMAIAEPHKGNTTPPIEARPARGVGLTPQQRAERVGAPSQKKSTEAPNIGAGAPVTQQSIDEQNRATPQVPSPGGPPPRDNEPIHAESIGGGGPAPTAGTAEVAQAPAEATPAAPGATPAVQPNAPEVTPAAPGAGAPDADLAKVQQRTAARKRFRAMAKSVPVAQAMQEMDELDKKGSSNKAKAEGLRAIARDPAMEELSKEDRDELSQKLEAAAADFERDKPNQGRAKLSQISRGADLETRGKAGDTVDFDGSTMEPVADTVPEGPVKLIKAPVVHIDPDTGKETVISKGLVGSPDEGAPSAPEVPGAGGGGAAPEAPSAPAIAKAAMPPVKKAAAPRKAAGSKFTPEQEAAIKRRADSFPDVPRNEEEERIKRQAAEIRAREAGTAPAPVKKAAPSKATQERLAAKKAPAKKAMSGQEISDMVARHKAADRVADEEREAKRAAKKAPAKKAAPKSGMDLLEEQEQHKIDVARKRGEKERAQKTREDERAAKKEAATTARKEAGAERAAAKKTAPAKKAAPKKEVPAKELTPEQKRAAEVQARADEAGLPTTVKDLRARAKEKKIKGFSTMTKEKLQRALLGEEVSTGTTKLNVVSPEKMVGHLQRVDSHNDAEKLLEKHTVKDLRELADFQGLDTKGVRTKARLKDMVLEEARGKRPTDFEPVSPKDALKIDPSIPDGADGDMMRRAMSDVDMDDPDSLLRQSESLEEQAKKLRADGDRSNANLYQDLSDQMGMRAQQISGIEVVPKKPPVKRAAKKVAAPAVKKAAPAKKVVSHSGHDGRDVTDEEERDFLTYPPEKQAEILGRIREPGTGRDAHLGTRPERDVELSPEREAEIRTAIEQIAAQRGTRSSGTGYVRMMDVREGLADRYPRAEVDKVIQAVGRTPDWNVIQESNQKVLTPRERLASVVLGNQDKQVIGIVRRGPKVTSAPTPSKKAPAKKAAPKVSVEDRVATRLMERIEEVNPQAAKDIRADLTPADRAEVDAAAARVRAERLAKATAPPAPTRAARATKALAGPPAPTEAPSSMEGRVRPNGRIPAGKLQKGDRIYVEKAGDGWRPTTRKTGTKQITVDRTERVSSERGFHRTTNRIAVIGHDDDGNEVHVGRMGVGEGGDRGFPGHQTFLTAPAPGATPAKRAVPSAPEAPAPAKKAVAKKVAPNPNLDGLSNEELRKILDSDQFPETQKARIRDEIAARGIRKLAEGTTPEERAGLPPAPGTEGGPPAADLDKMTKAELLKQAATEDVTTVKPSWSKDKIKQEIHTSRDLRAGATKVTTEGGGIQPKKALPSPEEARAAQARVDAAKATAARRVPEGSTEGRTQKPVQNTARVDDFNDAWDKAGIKTTDGSVQEVREDVAGGRLSPEEGIRRLETDISMNEADVAEMDAQLRNPMEISERKELRLRKEALEDAVDEQKKASTFLREHFKSEPVATPKTTQLDLPADISEKLRQADPEDLKAEARAQGIDAKGDTPLEVATSIMTEMTKKEIAKKAVKKAVPAKKAVAKAVPKVDPADPGKPDVRAIGTGLDFDGDDDAILTAVQRDLDGPTPGRAAQNLERRIKAREDILAVQGEVDEDLLDDATKADLERQAKKIMASNERFRELATRLRGTRATKKAAPAAAPAAPAPVKAAKKAAPAKRVKYDISRNKTMGINTHTSDLGHVTEFLPDTRGEPRRYRAYKANNGGKANFESLQAAKDWLEGRDTTTPGQFEPGQGPLTPAVPDEAANLRARIQDTAIERLNAAKSEQQAREALRGLTVPELRDVADKHGIPRGTKAAMTDGLVARHTAPGGQVPLDPAKLSSKAALPNNWGGGGGEVHFHSDGPIGMGLRSMGDERGMEVDGDRLDNVVGRLATDSVMGRVTTEEMLDRLRAMRDRLPEGSKARRGLDRAIADIDAPAITPLPLPDSAPAPIRRLMEEFSRNPITRGTNMGGHHDQRNSVMEQLRQAALRVDEGVQGGGSPWLAWRGELHKFRIGRAFHESNGAEGAFEMDRAVRKALEDMEALREAERKAKRAAQGLSVTAGDRFAAITRADRFKALVSV